MWAAVNIDHVAELQRIPEEWDKLKVRGSFMYWVLVDLENTSLDPKVPYIELTEYEALGWKFYGNSRGYLTFYEDSNMPDQLDMSRVVKHPKKRRDGTVVEWPMRYKYELSEQDMEQGLAFGKVMEPHVQRTFESQTR